MESGEKAGEAEVEVEVEVEVVVVDVAATPLCWISGSLR